MKTVTLAALALIGASFAATPASAMPSNQGIAKYVPQSQVVQVGHRRGKRFFRHHDDFRFGLGFGFPLVGLGAPLYADRYYDYDDSGRAHVEYCLDRYRSYDPETNTFMGYDGLRHECVSPYM
jgi:hypothetical protein